MIETQTQPGPKIQKAEKKIAHEARGLVEQLRDVPSLIERELKDNPYRTLGIVGAAGFGLGAMLGSRLLRVMLISAGGYAVNELLRSRISRMLDESELDRATD